MVPQGHHTIVETAWPMTRFNKITNMNYRIGFDDTLAPGEGALKNALARDLAEIRSAYSFCVVGQPRLDTLANYIKAKTRTQAFLGTQIVDRMFSRFHAAA